MTVTSRSRLSEIAAYVVAALGSLLAAGWALQLWRADLSVPFVYGGDALFTGAFTKSLIEHGSAVANPSIGAPGTGSLLDYPTVDAVHQFALRVLGWLTGDVSAAINLYFLLGFALTAIVSVAVLRAMKVSRVAAVTTSILFALLPYHFLRGEVHLFLSAYWMVPISVLLCLWVLDDEPFLFPPDSWKVAFAQRRTLIAAGAAVILGASGIYYAYFTCFLLLVAGVAAAIRMRGWRPLVASGLVVLAICFVVGAGSVQGIVYRAQAGPNEEVAERWVGEAEIYSLRLAQLVLPVSDHRLPLAARLKAAYRNVLATVAPSSDNENDTSSLGLVLSLGFLGLLAMAVWDPRRPRSQLPSSLALLTVASFLLATVSGLGLLFAMAITPQIRAYNRISVFIAFLAAAFVAWAIDRVRTRMGDGALATGLAMSVCALLVIGGALDQTTVGFVPDYAGAKAAYVADAAIVHEIETLVPEGAAIFQLPYMPFPENGPIGSMADYEHFKAYLHATSTVWSYGATRGRDDDLWQRNVSALPSPEMVAALKQAGFSGIWVDTRAYADAGAGVIQGLEDASGKDALYSEDGRIAFVLLDR